jgi:GNAT superfamily N-acetyltransferase
LSTIPDPSGGPVTVRPYDESLYEAHARFAARMWPNKRRRREWRYNRWKFRGGERGPVDGLLLAVSGGEVIGQIGLIPVIVDIGGERVRCQWVCDLMVESAYRGKGIASLIFDTARARGMVTLGSNPSPAADVSMRRIGFRRLEGPRIAVLPLDASHVLGWRIPARLAWMTRSLAPIANLVFRWRSRQHLVEKEIAQAQSAFAEPFIVHDGEFLRWRSEGLDGYSAPLGALKTPAGSHAIIGLATPYFNAYDWAAASWEEFLLLFSGIHARAARSGAKTIQAYAQNTQEEEWLRRAGFVLLRRPYFILCDPPERFFPRFDRMRYSVFDSDGNL